MARKRFMDADIWQKANFRKLEPKLKLAWFYLLSNCSHSGIYEVDIERMSFDIGQSYTLDEVKKSFEKHITDIGDSKWFIHSFIKFQYGEELNPNVRVHQSVIKQLKKYDIDLAKTDKGLKDKDKGKDKSKDIKVRLKEFADRVEKEVFDMHLDPQMVKDFIEYWTEHNTNGSVLRYEQQSIFNIRKRMSTWKKNDKKFNSNLTFQAATDEDIAKREARIEADYKAQQERFKEADNNVADDEERKKALGID